MLNAGLKASQLSILRATVAFNAIPAKEVPYGAIICPFTHSLHKTVRIMALEANMPNVTFLGKDCLNPALAPRKAPLRWRETLKESGAVQGIIETN